MIKEWQKKHGLTSVEVAELLGLKSAQQVRNKNAGVDGITEKDIILMRLWDVLFSMIQQKIDRFYRGETVIDFTGDPGDLDGGIKAVAVARELLKSTTGIHEALERAAAKS